MTDADLAPRWRVISTSEYQIKSPCGRGVTPRCIHLFAT
jgi:hypothetical protein